MKSIIYIINSTTLSGAEKRICRIIREIKLNYTNNVIVILRKELYKALEKSTEEYAEILHLADKIHQVEIASNLPSILKLTLWNFKVIKLITKYPEVNIIHILLDKNLPIVVKSILSKKKVIFEISSPDVVDVMVNGFRKNLFSKDLFLNYVSQTVRDRHVKKSNPSNPFKVATIPYYQPKNVEVEVSKKEKLIIYGSRFIERKNPILFAKVAKRILAKHKDWSIKMLGEGPLEAELRSILSEEISAGRVFIGRVPSLFETLIASKIYVSLIVPDNFPSQSLLEAMEAKNAIIANNVGLTHTLVSDNGILVDLNEDKVFEAIENLINDEVRLEQLCENSFSKIRADFSPKRYIEDFTELYL